MESAEENKTTVKGGAERLKKTKKRNKKKNRHKRDSLPQCTSPLLCFDSETTNHGELLELSVFDVAGNEVYHRYFRPHAKNWPSDIHHITPDMVAGAKRFIAHRGEIGYLINGSKFLLGCALSNDIHNLKRHGVETSDGHVVIDIQSWYWLLRDNTDRREKFQTGLAAIGESYGLDFGEGQAHSATADTKLTLECFKAMVDDFNRQFPDEDGPEVDLSDERYLNRLVSRFNEEYKKAMQIYRMRNAGGFVSVVRREQGYSLKFHRILPDDTSKYVLSSAVEDRAAAERELRIFLKHKELKGLTGIYDLREVDFDFLRHYTNEMDEEKYLAEKSGIKPSAAKLKATKAAKKALSSASSARKLTDKSSPKKKKPNKSTTKSKYKRKPTKQK